MSSNLIVVLGGTGTQGGSVIDAFLKDPSWRVRTVTRDPSKPVSKALEERGVEVVQGSFEDEESLRKAFVGATAIFAVTDFWATMFSPAAHASLTPGLTINEHSYNVELAHGRTIAAAAAHPTVLATLERFVWSTLADVRGRSGGKYTQVWHFDSKAAVDAHIAATHPALWARTSTLQVGYYADNWKKMVRMGPRRVAGGPGEPSIVEWTSPCRPATEFPWVETRADVGKMVRALVLRAPAGTKLLGVSRMVSYEEYMRVWSEVVGVPSRYRQISDEEYMALMPAEIAREILESNSWNEEFGWDGREEGVLRPWDLKLEEPLTTLEDYLREQDWSSVLND